MKLAYLVNQYPHVSHTFIRREIAALESNGLDVHRFTIRKSANKLVDPIDQEEQGRTQVILGAGCFALTWMAVRAALRHPMRFAQAVACAWRLGNRSGQRVRTFAYLVEAAWLRQRLKAIGVQHLHSHFGTNSTAVALLCRHLGGPPYSFTVHGPEEFDQPTALSLTEKISGASFVVAISEFGRSQLFRWCDSSQWHKVHIVHCGIDASYLESPSTEENLSHRFVSVGRLCEQKGQLVLLQTARKLRDAFPDLEIVLVGDGPMRAELDAVIGKYGLQGTVRITGWLSNEAVQSEIKQGRAFILPSFAEGLPVVLMEALALGKPAISTYVAGIPEIIHDGQNGRLVTAGSVESLMNAMLWMLNCTPDELRRMGDRGREIVRERHDVKREAAKLQYLFQATIAN